VTNKVRIAVVGSGPAGLSCAARAAHHGLTHVLLEAEAQPCNTIHLYQKGKHVMAEPAVLPLRSDMTFTAGRREAVLSTWAGEIEKHKINARYRSAVTAIRGSKGAFEVVSAAGDIWHAEHVVLCIGLQGNLRRLGVPGDEVDRVQYQLDDPAAYAGETVVVVGAGDAAIENAIALAQAAKVILINRGSEFARAKQGNLDAVLAAIAAGRIDCRYGTAPLRVEEAASNGGSPLRLVVRTPKGEETIGCHRVIARLGAIPPRKVVESFGVQFPSASVDAVPRVSVTYESNVPGLYVIGALAGYPLIKQCMNQGYEVVEYILGNPLKPADEPLLKKKLAAFPRDGGVSRALALVQKQVPLFADMSTLQRREFMLESDLRTPKPGEVIFRKGEYSNSFFSILEGQVALEIDDKGKTREIVRGRGEFFGELGLLSGRRRSGTASAGTNCIVIESPRRSMLRLMGNVEAVRRKIDQTSLRRAVQTYIAPGISEADLDEMVGEAVVKTFAAGETLFSEGDEPDGLYLIRRGSVTISRIIGGKEIVLSYVAAGNYVGEMALLSQARRMATVRAAVTTECIILPTRNFERVLERNEALRGGMEAQVLQRLTTNVRREAEPDPGNLVSFLLSQGLGEATDVLLIDESLCIRCDQCERACADTHGGTSRLDRQAGPTYANIHVPTSCRHCENPKCMTDCPPDAIHRNPSGEVYIQDTCIGCGNCEKNCPYGVIQLAPLGEKRGASLWAWLLTGLTAEPGREPLKVDDDQPKKAVKCDMCRDLSGGPACVRACPTGAAIRVSPEEFLSVALLERGQG
jgi:CRP-like cAMP-binding protein/Fe-S-cluster-containing dehydrogenase component/thioredoxin reductase